MTINDILKNKDYLGLPEKERKRVWEKLFDRQYSQDPDYLGLPSQEQAKARNTYVAKLMEQDRQAMNSHLTGIKPYNPDTDPINQAVNPPQRITTFDSNITNPQGVIKPNLEGYDTTKKITAKEVVENKARQAGREYSRKLAEDPFSHQQNPNAPGYMTTQLQREAGLDQIREEERDKKAKQKAIDIDQEMKTLENEYRDNDIRLVGMSARRDVWTDKEKDEYSTLLQRQAKIEVDAPAVAMGMSRRQYDAFQAGRELIKENPAWSYLDALGAGGVRLITSPYTLFAPGSELADVNRYADQGIASEGKVLGNIIRSTIASMPVNAAMMFAPQLAIPLTYTDITASNIKDYYDEKTLDASAMWASATSGLIQTAIEYGFDTAQMNLYRKAYREGGAAALKDTVKRSIQDATSNGIGKAARTIGQGTLTEMSEEVFQNISDKIARNVINGDPLPQSKEELLAYGKELAMDAAGGAFGGFVTGSIGTGVKVGLHANTKAYIQFNAPRYDSVAMLLQSLEEINSGDIQAAEQSLAQAKSQLKVDQITAKPLMRGFNLATDAINMAKAQQAVSVKVENEALADDIRKMSSERNSLVQEGHVAGFETSQGERLYTLEEQIKSKERQIKKSLSKLQETKDLEAFAELYDKAKIVELYETAKQLQEAGMSEEADKMLNTAVEIRERAYDRENEIEYGESRSIEEENQRKSETAERLQKDKAILQEKLAAEQNKPLTENKPTNIDQPAANQGKQGDTNDSANPDRIPGERQGQQTTVPPNPNPGTSQDTGKDTTQIQEGDGRPNQDKPVGDQPQESDQSPLQKKGDLYIFRRKGRKPIFAVIERQDKNNFYTVDGKVISKKGKTAIKYPDYVTWENERSKSERRSLGSRKSFNTKFGDKTVVNESDLKKLPYLSLFRGKTFSKGDAPFQDVYVRVRGLKTEPLINVVDGHEGENWDTVIGEGSSSDLPEYALAAETNDASLFLEKAVKEYYNYFYAGRSGAETDIYEQLQREGQAEDEDRKYRKSILESMSESERNEFLDSLSEQDKEKYLESIKDDIESLDEESRDFEKETGEDYESVKEYQEGDPEQQFDTSQYEDEVDLEEGIQDNLEGIEPILDGENLVDPKTGKTLFKTTKDKSQAKTDHLSNEMAEDALLGMIKSHIESIEHDGDTMTVNLKGGRTLVLNQITGEYQVRDHDGNIRTMRGKTDSSTINGNLKVVIDLVKGLNGGNRTLYHEAFHAAWRLFFTPAEVKLIVRYYSKRVGKNMIDIEEAAANAADQYLGNRNDVPPGLRTIFRRFWDRVRHFLVKIGFATDKQRIQDLFRRMENDQLTGEGVQDESDGGEQHRYKTEGERIRRFNQQPEDISKFYKTKSEAIKALFERKAGQVVGAFNREGLGSIDLMWGWGDKDSGGGLAHILDKHPEITPEILSEAMNLGSMYNDLKFASRKLIRYAQYTISIETNYYGFPKNWVVTAYKNSTQNNEGASSRSIDGQGTKQGHHSNPAQAHPDTIVPKPDVTSRHKLLGVYGVMKWAKGKKLDKLMGDLNLAERMFREGYNAKAVRYATGWEIGIDGKWRYELPDTEVKIKNLGGTFMSIDGITQPTDAATNGYTDKIKNHLLPHKLTKFPTIVIEGLEDSLLDAVFAHGNSNAGNWSEPIGWLSYGSRLGTIIGDRELTTTERARVQRWVRANTKHILSLNLKQHKIEGKLQEHNMESPSHILSFLPKTLKGRYWSIQLPELLEDKDLFKAYPSMKDIVVVFHPMTMGGYFSERNGIIGVDINYGEPGKYFTGRRLAWLKQTMLHEVQHAIQSHEGFARGGNEKSANRDFPYEKMEPEEKYMRLLGEVESRNVEMRSRYDAKKLRNTPLKQTEDRYREDQLWSTYDKAAPVLLGDTMVRIRNYGGKLVPADAGEWDLFLPPSIRAKITKEVEALKKNILEKDKKERGIYTAILGWLFEKNMMNYLAANRFNEYLENNYWKAIEETRTQWAYDTAPQKWKDIYERAWKAIPGHLSKMTVIRPGIDNSLWREIRPDEMQAKESLREALIRNTWNREDDKSFARQVVDQFFIELQSLPQAPKWGERLLGYATATEMAEALDKAFKETEKEIKNLKKVTKPHRQALMFALNLLDGEASDIARIAAKAARITSQERVAAAAVRRYKTLPGRYENGYKEFEFNHLEITPEMRSDLVGKGLPRYKTLEPARYYNSHGYTSTWKDIRDVEVNERGNYSKRDFDAWAKKYNIGDDDQAIWVTPNKNMAYTYDQPAQDRDRILGMKEEELNELGDVAEFNSNQGFIIPESDDGDYGYLFVLRESENPDIRYKHSDEAKKLVDFFENPPGEKARDPKFPPPWHSLPYYIEIATKEIYNKYKDTDQWLKAPNGKPTNLNERQWLLVRTKAFKDWFGDWENDPENASKIVDENGEPKVVAHRSDKDFNEFKKNTIGTVTDSGRYGRGFSFSDRGIGWYGEVEYKCFLNIRNPIKYTGNHKKDIDKYGMGEMRSDNGKNLSTYTTEWLESEDNWDYLPVSSWALNRFYKKHGYDGVIFQRPSDYAGGNEYMIIEPNQAKSATHNIGTYKTHRNSIRHKLTDLYHGSGAFFDRFDVNFIGTGEGAQAFGWGLYVTERKGVGRDYAEKLGRKSGKWYENLRTRKNAGAISREVWGAIEQIGLGTWKVPGNMQAPSKTMLDNAVKYINNKYDEDIYHARHYNRNEQEAKEIEEAKNYFIPYYGEAKKLILDEVIRIKTAQGRNLYTINVWEDRTEDVLDWYGEVPQAQLDKILKQAEIEGMDSDNITLEPLDDEDRIIGKNLYDSISTYMYWDVMPNEDISPDASDKEKEAFATKLASEFLLRAGIDGIKYPVNATSGGKGEKGYNYVVFDANQISITHHERWKLLDEDIEERLRAAKKLLQQHNQEYAKITKQAAEKIAEKIVDETGIEPIAGKEKIARMIRAAYREGEEKARASMAILKIANVGQKIATNKPESTDRSDMTFHLDEAEQYAKDMGISQDELDSLGADGYTFYAQGLNLFAYGNTLYDQLLEKRSQAAQNAAKGIIDQNLTEEIAILTSATADAVMRYDHIKTNAGRILRHAREEKSMRIGRLVQLSISLNEERDRLTAEIGDLRKGLEEDEKMMAELDAAIEQVLDEVERLTGQRYKSEYVDDLRNQLKNLQERRAILRNRRESRLYQLNKVIEGLKLSESQITKIDEQIAKTELKLSPQEMQTLQSLAKGSKLESDAKGILEDLIKAWRPLTSAERNILKSAHDTIASLNNQELILLKKLWERKHTISEFPPLKPSKWDIARSIFYQNILSSPMTHVKNLVGNESNLALENLVNMIMDKGFASTLQSIADTKQGIKSAKAALQDGAEYMKKYDMSMTNARLMRKFTLVTRILAAEDAFFFRRGYGAQLMSLAIAESRKTGIAIQELMVNPTAAMIKQAEYEASRATFNYDPEGILGAVVSGVEKAFNTMEQLGAPGRTAALLLKMKVLPFTRVVANVFNAGLDWTPLGFLGAAKYTGAVDKLQQRNIWKDANGKPIVSPYKNRDITRQLIRATLGTIGMALAYALLGDLLSGGGSDDPEERRQMQETGWRPYSIKIGDRWIPYTMLPISPALAVIANYNEAQNRPNRKASTEESISYAMMGIMSTMLDKSFLSGLSGVIEAVARKDKKYFMRSMGETPAQVLPVSPNFFRFFNDLIYTRQHNPETTAQYMMYSLRPWTSAWMKEGVPTRIDVLGNETRKDPRWQEIIGSPIREDQPLYVVDRNNIPSDIRTTLNAILSSGLKIPSTTSYEIKIEEDQYITLKGFDKERYLRTRGMEVSMSLVDNAYRIESLADSGEIDELHKLLQKIGSDATRNAKKAMVDEYFAEETKHKYKPYSKSRDKE